MKIDRIRVLKDGTEAEELEHSVVLYIKTKCPDKWVLEDRETGVRYRPTGSTEMGKMFARIEEDNDNNE